MANSKLIVVEGPQGVGKTTITNYIRSAIPYTNLYRLSGTEDSSPTGLAKSQKMYWGLLDYIKTLENTSINLLFDRTFFTEEIYCRLGFKEYQFTETFNELLDTLSKMDFEFYYITLYLSDENEFERRLMREGKGTFKYAKFNKESSINQQNAYLNLATEIEEKCPNIHVIRIDNTKPLNEIEEQIKNILS